MENLFFSNFLQPTFDRQLIRVLYTAMPSTFRTVERQEEAISPSKGGPHNPRLSALSAPHVESFNTIFELAGGPGILERAIQDIGKVTVFDGTDGSPNKLEGK